MQTGKVEKCYIARVQGDFNKICDQETKRIDCTDSIYEEYEANIKKMICCPKEKVPSNQVKSAKDAHTSFEFVGYPKDST